MKQQERAHDRRAGRAGWTRRATTGLVLAALGSAACSAGGRVQAGAGTTGGLSGGGGASSSTPDAGDAGTGGTGGALACAPSSGGPGSFVWSHGYGMYSNATGLAVDAEGSVVVVGIQDSVGGTIDFGCGALTGLITGVAKLDTTGKCRWSKGFVTGALGSPAVAVDPSRNVVVTDWSADPVDLGGGPLPANSSYIVSLDPDGAYRWSKAFGEVSGAAMAADRSGNIALTAVVSGDTEVDLGGPAITSGMFVAELAPSGAPRWTKGFPGAEPGGIAFDAGGDVLLAGSFKDAVDFGGGALTSVNGSSLYAVKLAPTGDHVWSKAFNHTQPAPDGSVWNYATVTGVGVLASGNLVSTGFYAGTLDFGGGLPPAEGGTFLVELDPTGAPLWAKGFAGGIPTGVTAAPSGDVFIAGDFDQTVDLGGGALMGGPGAGIYVAGFDAGGDYRWGKAFGDMNGGQVMGPIAADPCGHVVAVGRYEGPIDFGGGPLPASEAAFAAQFVQ
jgi:hypothetical protein